MIDRLRRWAHRNRDLSAVLIPPIVFAILGATFDVAETLHAYSIHYEDWQIDELATMLIGAGLVYFVVLIRRTRRLRRELHLRREAEGDARRLALQDPLTELPNRRAMLARIVEESQRASGEEQISVLALDLDRFKPINDTYGHEGGDRALRVIAERLVRIADGRAMVARMGGDEFACLIRHKADSELPAQLAEEMLTAVAKPIQLASGMAEVSASIGVVRSAPGARSPDEMLRAADFAMYRAKAAGRSTWTAFAPSMETEMRERAELELEMHAGINRGEFVPHFQPIVELSSGKVIGFEALARWKHPSRGEIMPDTFIPIAEDAGMIQELGLAVLRRACIEARQWPHGLTLSVNISPLQLNDPWLPQRILKELCTTGFPAGRLIVEITENRLVQDMEAARRILASLKNAGVQIALDDFGTGYASLKHLRELDFNRIKIDRNFVIDMRSSESAQIVRAILSLSEGLGLPVTAEGVETEESADHLAGLGCEYGQGYLFSRPVDSAGARAIAMAAPYRRHGEPSRPGQPGKAGFSFKEEPGVRYAG